MMSKIPITQILWIALMILVVYTVINISSNYVSVSKMRELEGFDGHGTPRLSPDFG